jgi:hypothetical protein
VTVRRSGVPIALRHCRVGHEYPDFHSAFCLAPDDVDGFRVVFGKEEACGFQIWPEPCGRHPEELCRVPEERPDDIACVDTDGRRGNCRDSVGVGDF